MNRTMKRNAREIAPASQRRCYNRAISTMRLALGYKTGLPSGWAFDGSVPFRDVVTSLSKAFPNHNVYLCVPRSTYDLLMNNGYQQSGIYIRPSLLGLVSEREDDFL
jgi:hypothetical protein